MTDSTVSPSVVQAFYQAYVSRDPVRVAPFLADDVEWTITGPSEIFPFCGQRRGKDIVLHLFASVGDIFDAKGFEADEMLIDGDCVATFCKISGVLRSTGRTISFRCAQFVRFKNDKVVCYRSIIDSFDAAEQWIGHRIEVERELLGAPVNQAVRKADVIAV